MIQRLGLLLTALLLVPAAGANAQIHVDKDASGAGDGTSWTDAYTNLQDALAEATASDEIWIAEGVYTPDPDGTDETVSFTITGGQDGLALYGGFDGTESQRSGRDPSQHVTVLSGDLGGDDNTNADGVTESYSDINGGNSDHVLVLDGTTGGTITESTVIDGVTVTGGQADGSAPANKGGGLFCDGKEGGNECSPLLSKMVFVGNMASDAGGALFNRGVRGVSSPTITDVVFSTNQTTDGGAIASVGVDGTARPTIVNSAFVTNSVSNYGGAIYNQDASPQYMTKLERSFKLSGEVTRSKPLRPR